MLHAIATPNVGRYIVHHLQEGAAVWGQRITPSVAHIIQIHKELGIGYSRVAPGIVFESVTGTVLMPHVIDQSRLRLHADAAVFRRARGGCAGNIDAVLHCDVGVDCRLKLWGTVTAEETAVVVSAQTGDCGITVPVAFTVTFWEIAHSLQSQMQGVDTEKDQRIKVLESRVAMSMCSQ